MYSPKKSDSTTPKKKNPMLKKRTRDAIRLIATATRAVEVEKKRKLSMKSMLAGVETNKNFSDEFLAAIPKAELHSHLDGGVRIQTLIELAEEFDITLPYHSVSKMKEHIFKDKYGSLEEYLQPFGLIVDCLRTPLALERVAYEFAVDSFKDGVRYFEMRFAPQLHCSQSMDICTVLNAVNEGCRRATMEINAKDGVHLEHEPEYGYGIIVCCLRMFTSEMSSYYRNLYRVHSHVSEERILSMASMSLVSAAVYARDTMNLPIVAMDIAGAEDGYPPQTHKQAFDFAHKHFLNITIHAAEGFGPESLFRAITDCYAERIGHGYHIFSTHKIKDKSVTDPQKFVDSLVRYVADSRITMEVCLTSNIQTMPELKNIKDHNLGKMIKNKMAVAICTDNRTVSHTTITKELRLAVDAFELSPKELRDIVIGSFKRSFYPTPYLEKREYLNKIISYYESLEKKFGVVHGLDESESSV